MKYAKQKERKLTSMLEAAYGLFTNKGINDTSIDDIVKEAKVAKGTFYLYFKDKHDLIDRIVAKKSAAVIVKALAELDKACQTSTVPFSFADRIVFFADYVIGYLQKNKRLLLVLHKNLSLGLYSTQEAHEAIARFCQRYVAEGGEPDTAKQVLFMIVETVSAICYSAIIEEKPYTMDEMRPVLYKTLRKMVE